MKASILLALVCTAVLAAGARADAPGEPETLVRKMQEYAQKAVAVAKSAFSMVQESEVAQEARRWLEVNAKAARESLARLAAAWKQTPGA